jgi:hypothetical protein
MFRSTISAWALGLAVLCAGVGAGSANAGERGDDAKPAAVMSQEQHKTSAFQGVKANTGYAIHYRENGKSMLKVSDDFVIPDAPAPSWQIVDSSGNVYLLKQFKIKGGTNRQIEVPSYVKDIAKVQVWCSYAEVLLGEASFAEPVK